MAPVTPSPPLEASVHVDAPPDAVWAVVGDPRRTGEWSPECRRVVVLGRGPLRAGSLLVGVNRRRAVVWATTSRIDTHDPGREIAWAVRESATRWSYLVEPDGVGTRLVQRREAAGASAFAAWFARTFLGGRTEHDVELLAGMTTGLQRIKQIVADEGV